LPPHQTRPWRELELAQPMPRPGAVGDQVDAGAAQVTDRFFGHGGDADGDQLAGAVQPR
jgi:hypothetical protein